MSTHARGWMQSEKLASRDSHTGHKKGGLHLKIVSPISQNVLGLKHGDVTNVFWAGVPMVTLVLKTPRTGATKQRPKTGEKLTACRQSVRVNWNQLLHTNGKHSAHSAQEQRDNMVVQRGNMEEHVQRIFHIVCRLRRCPHL